MTRSTGKARRFTADEIQLVLRLLAEWAPLSEIAAEFERTFGRAIPHRLIQHYRDSPKWRPEIEKLRTALVNRISDIPIASKFWRLRERQRLFAAENRYRVVRYAGMRKVTRQTDGSVVEEPIAIEELPLGELRQLLLDSAKETGDLLEKVEHHVTLEHLVPDGLPPAPPEGKPRE